MQCRRAELSDAGAVGQLAGAEAELLEERFGALRFGEHVEIRELEHRVFDARVPGLRHL